MTSSLLTSEEESLALASLTLEAEVDASASPAGMTTDGNTSAAESPPTMMARTTLPCRTRPRSTDSPAPPSLPAPLVSSLTLALPVRLLLVSCIVLPLVLSRGIALRRSLACLPFVRPRGLRGL